MNMKNKTIFLVIVSIIFFIIMITLGAMFLNPYNDWKEGINQTVVETGKIASQIVVLVIMVVVTIFYIGILIGIIKSK